MLAAHARRHPAQRGAVPAREGGVGVAREAQARARPGQAAREHLEGLRARRRAARRREQKERFRAINTELAGLGVKFGDDLLKETNAYQLVIDEPADLAGLSERGGGGRGRRRQAGRPRGQVAVHAAARRAIWPFLEHAENRELRRQSCRPTLERCDHGDALDNKARSQPHRGAARRARAAARLQDPRRLRAGREHGQDAGRGATACSTSCGRRRVAVAEPRGGRPAGGDPGRRQGLHARAVGLVATTPRRCARRATTSTRQALRPYFELEQRARGRVRRGQPALRHHLHRAHRPAGLQPRGEGLRGEGRRRLAPRRLLRGLLPAPGKRGGAWSDRVPPAAAMQDGKDGARRSSSTCCNFSRPAGDAARAALARRGRDAVPRVRPRPARHALAASATAASATRRATSSSCPRRSWRTGRPSPRC